MEIRLWDMSQVHGITRFRKIFHFCIWISHGRSWNRKKVFTTGRQLTKKIRFRDGEKRESIWYSDLSVIFRVMKNIWISRNGCMRRVERPADGMTERMAKVLHRIIIIRRSFPVMSRRSKHLGSILDRMV